MRLLIQLTENDKRFIIAFFLAVILIFVFIGYIGYWITRIMDVQGRRLDSQCFDVVTTRVITNKKDFRKYARRKSFTIFYKAARIPLLVIVLSGVAILFHFLINGFQTNLFDPNKGFSSILFLWNFNDPELYQTFFGIKVIAKWPELYSDIGKPQFVWSAIPSYLGVLGATVGILWYLVTVQALIARGLRIRKLCDTIFDKSLEGFNQNAQLMQQMNINISQQQPPIQQPPVQQPTPQPSAEEQPKNPFKSLFK